MQSEISRLDWYDWPEATTVGGCNILVTHDRETKTAVSVLAQPCSIVDQGAIIHCFLPSKPSENEKFPVFVGPSVEAYWSSRRRGPATKNYFHEKRPKLAVALLHALESQKRDDRVRALVYLAFSENGGIAYQKGETISTIADDVDRYTQLTENWINGKRETENGVREVETAKRHVREALVWYQSLIDLTALCTGGKREKGIATPTQCAVILSLMQAARECCGIPLLSDVRRWFHEIVIRHEKIIKEVKPGGDPDKVTINSIQKNKAKAKGIRLNSFDKALKDLGFSWIPSKWPSQD